MKISFWKYYWKGTWILILFSIGTPIGFGAYSMEGIVGVILFLLALNLIVLGGVYIQYKRKQ